ncbi:hypothetical protein AB838_16630 [Rhodobacteraceae bacterium (ex Bugula neritina AB1)]|nr:hypothetical protein AB838_16630 [Rhodobacteraceae bacterium (ex Bugula neritina AB1)]
MTDAIKSMQLYPRAERILDDLAALGYSDDSALSVAEVNQFDQLHYHGTDAIDAAITACGIQAGDRVLEVGAGWGGCARYLAQATGAHVTAVELQADYHHIGTDLTLRTRLSHVVNHVHADFLSLDLPSARFDHVVSWLALFHIPDRASYLARIHRALAPEGKLFAEDLFALSPVSLDEQADFSAHLFPNSLVDWDSYQSGLVEAGFGSVSLQDMTDDWTRFTAERLSQFRAQKAAYLAVHGEQGYALIEQFYDKMAGYLARGLVGGVQLVAEKPAL